MNPSLFSLIRSIIIPFTTTLIKKGFKVPEHLFEVNEKKKRIEIAGWILEKIVKKLDNEKCKCYIVEEYPTADHLEVERIPLTSKG